MLDRLGRGNISNCEVLLRRLDYRLVRYADDFLILVAGDREHAARAKAEAATVLAAMGLRLSGEKTSITHIDEGLDFLGWHIQRHRKRGTSSYFIYTYPSKKALRSVMAKVKLFDGASREQLAELGDVRTPGIADVFVATIGGLTGESRGAGT